MIQANENKYQFFSDPLRMYTSMLSDIENAQHYIYLETYKFSYQALGKKFRYLLQKKCKEGVQVKLLIDSWGTGTSRSFFSDIVQKGGEVRYFKKIKLTFDALTKHHRRDHRKLLIIDDKITYIGSANITDHCINWRESNLRLMDEITVTFKKIFLQNFEIYNKYFYDKIAYTKPFKLNGFEIIRDVPTTLIQPTRRKLMELLQSAQKKITIETPYFLPGTVMRKAIKEAAQRGVEINIIVPKRSDVGLVDILRNRYLGKIFAENIHIFFYIPQNLHAKLFIVDDSTFVLGSSNFDYRSFRFQHEVNLVGKNKQIINQIEVHIEQTLSECEEFDYNYWLKRSPIQKFFEFLLIPFRHLF